MTVLFITRKYPPSKGGMQNFAYDLSNELGRQVDVKLVKWGGSNIFLPLVMPIFFFRAFLLLSEGNIDVVHAQDGVTSTIACVLSKLFRKPFTVVLHGLDITYNKEVYQAIVPRCVRKADVVFCISQATADDALKRGVPASKIRVLPLGITDDFHASKQTARKRLLKELNLEAETKILLTIGRLVERKGVAWFVLNVMPKLVKQYPDIVYLVVGGGENETKIKDAIESKKLEKYTRMLGSVPNDMLSTLYNGADVFVQPNIAVPGNIEGFGRILLEASLCELPVVASGIEGIKDAIMDGKNGILVKSKDANAFVWEIGAFLKDKQTAKSFGVKSRKYTLANYKWDKIVSEYISEYEKLLWSLKLQ